jgi:hypothetical protein
MWFNKQQEDCAGFEKAIGDLEHIDIDAEVQAHRDLEAFHVKKKTIDEANRYIRQIAADDAKQQKLLDKLRTEIEALDNHKCHSCGQDLHDNKQDELKQAKEEMLRETALQLLANDTQRNEHLETLNQLGVLGVAPNVFYDTLEDALNHRNTLSTLRTSLDTRQSESDPYTEQIADMQGQALQIVSYDHLNELTRVQDHQDFLLKLLTSKDSFVRKKIIDQNLSYLNSRLTHYLDRIGLPHTVKFMNDLSVSIEELGRELDFDNLSRGERNRLILSMSWAFRDVWESLYSPINLLFIHEMIDNGLDTQGVENALGLLKKMSRERHKSIWLVSHRDELTSRVENILKVVKENGFTSYNTDVEIA